MYWENNKDCFWKKIEKKSSSDCWEWLGGCDTYGYGAANTRIKNYKAHRVAYGLTYGLIPDGMCVCHICDNPPCCNPNHLFLGTPKDNMMDRDKKHRGIHFFGEKCASHKLKECDVIEIKKLYAS